MEENKKKIFKKVNKKIKEEKTKIEILISEKKRLLAEIVNKQIQSFKEIERVRKYCTQDLVENLISILNNFEISLSFKVKEEETKRFLKGVEITQNMLEKKLEEYGLKKIICKELDVFNEKYHEVIETKWNLNYKENTILKIKQSGYELYNRILQPTKIILNKKDIKEKELKKCQKQ